MTETGQKEAPQIVTMLDSSEAAAFCEGDSCAVPGLGALSNAADSDPKLENVTEG